MLLLVTNGEFYINKTTPLLTNSRDFEGLFVNGKRIFPVRCKKELIVIGKHEVTLKQVGKCFEVVKNGGMVF